MNIEIYGADWCSYCNQAKLLCEINDLGYKYHDIGEGDNALTMLQRAVGTSLPQIFIDNHHIGGYTELKEYLDGEEES